MGTKSKRRPNAEAIDIKIGTRLRMLRIERGLSQEKLGAALGVSFQQIQKYENGSNAVASTRIPRLCQILRIEPNGLFENFVMGSAVESTVGVYALGIGMRVEKLDPKGRLAMGTMLDFIEANGGRV